jgi:hypothetical protein
MSKGKFMNNLKESAKTNTLMTPKHDPENLSTTYPTYRTVLSYTLADNLEAFMGSGDYDVIHYENTNPCHSNDYFEIIPTAGFSVPASGVEAHSPFATSKCDRLVAVPGKKQGWHIFGEDSDEIQNKVHKGQLKKNGKLN